MSEELRSIPPQHGSFVFTSESVTEGHPDKIADQISDAVLDAILAKEIELQEQGYIAPNGVPANVENVRCACETLVTTGTVIVAGEIRTQAYVDVQEIARGVIRRIGYNRAKFGFDCDTCGVMSLIHEQSPDIAQGVDESFETQTGVTTDPIDLIGAGDQGMMFGYASNETKTLMPMPHYLASRLAERLAAVRHDGTLPYLRPDGKTQVTVRYEDGKPVEVTTIVISTQHAAEIEDMGKIKDDLIEHVITPVMAAVTAVTAVGVDDDLAAGQAAVALRAADDEAAGRVDINFRFAVEQARGDGGLDDQLDHIAADGLQFRLRRVLRGDDHGVDALGLAGLVVLDCDLRLAVGTQIVHKSLLAHLGQALGHLVRE